MIHVAPRFLTVFSSFHRFRGGLPKCHKLGGHASKRSYSQQSQDPRSQIKPHSAPFQARTHTCGQLSAADNGSRVILGGWLLPERKGKLVSFFPLKDSHGTTQLIVDRSNQASLLHGLSNVPTESVVLIEGTVVLRPQSARRHGGTGDIDVQVDNYTLLNPADPAIPFLSSNVHNLPNDELRSRYRYLDLRRDPVSQNLRKRSQVAHIIRNLLHEQDFLEVETPVLLRSSPEGAREFLVPTRSLSGSNIGNLSDAPLFYALQQSPQQPKQLLMCSGGVDRYYQLARCFRDEDGRKDRQPEFTQVDMEMAFVSWGTEHNVESLSTSAWRIGGQQIRDVVESLIRRVWSTVEGVSLPERFKVMTYHDAMTRYGSDKPDTRYGLEIANLTPSLPHPLRDPLAKEDEVLECILVPKGSKFIQASNQCEASPQTERVTITDENITSWAFNNSLIPPTPPEIMQSSYTDINGVLNVKPGDDVWLSRRSRRPQGGSTALGRLRTQLFQVAQGSGAYKPTTKPHFLWITEFPLFMRGDQDKEFLAHGRWSSTHHPFTAPMWQDIEAMYNGDLAAVRGQHYDLVLDGVEIGGGSVRIHDAAMQGYIFSEVLQLTESEKAPFNHLLHALKCGAPPHGGIALGFDRLMAILCQAQSIREVIAFPKTSVGTDLLFKSPAPVNEEVLYQYGLQPRSTTR
ncbi:hypothetical protein CCMSSC00406_0001616 [Pleurotus cornucopiae]|uniref:Uncharacterized protein n=1 Tax=Pleurotus cornucopiae TaxID=5321 RepID=A0ACB7IMU6_PLECO|nr:hypothetical protein CCMSSC00406_0001616 [Pleurotus cornucopiae]